MDFKRALEAWDACNDLVTELEEVRDTELWILSSEGCSEEERLRVSADLVRKKLELSQLWDRVNALI